MPQASVDIQGLSKRYHIGRPRAEGRRGRRALDALAAPLRRLRRFGRSSDRDEDTLWALRDVSLRIQPGEVVGFIGPNGAGKSTLLKVLGRITPPTAGRAVLRGRVGSLLEVGTGFHPELTGRENVFLSGAILGMRRAEIRRRFDEIVAFAGVARHIDTPVKRYSSGMRVRLGFAVAAHLDADILLVDEVLAVGDAAFQARCLGKMGEIGRGGRTVLFVSHNMGSIRSLCDRVVWLADGQIAAAGEPDDVVAAYLAEQTASVAPVSGRRAWAEADAPGGRELRLLSVAVRGQAGAVRDVFTTDETIHVCCEYRQAAPLAGLRFVVQVCTARGETAFTSTDHAIRGRRRFPPGGYTTTCAIPGELLNLGEYTVRVWAGIPDVRYLIRPVEAVRFRVTGLGNQGSDFPDKRAWPGAVCPRLAWTLHEPVAASHGVS